MEPLVLTILKHIYLKPESNLELLQLAVTNG